jgi:hypothetical protein
MELVKKDGLVWSLVAFMLEYTQRCKKFIGQS